MNTIIKQLEQLGFQINPTSSVTDSGTTTTLTYDKYKVEIYESFNKLFSQNSFSIGDDCKFENAQSNEFLESVKDWING